MQRHEAYLRSARQSIRSAEHMLKIAYAMLSEPRTLIAATSRIFSSMQDSISAILSYERIKGRIPHEDGIDDQFAIFKARQYRRYRFKEDYCLIMQEVRRIVDSHKESPMEFARHGNLIICGDSYACTVVSPELVAKYLEKAKLFIHEAETLCSND